MTGLRHWLSFTLVTVTAGCGPRIYSFDVSPRTPCHSEETQLSYRVRGTPKLYVRFAAAHSQDTVHKGYFAEPDTIEFRFVVSKGGTDSVRRIAILQFSDSAHTDVPFATKLAGDTIVASGVKSPSRWSDRFAIVTVASGSGRPIEARHGGKVVQLDGAGDPSAALNGIPVEGAWELRSPLASAGGAAGRVGPDRLSVSVSLQCRRNP